MTEQKDLNKQQICIFFFNCLHATAVSELISERCLGLRGFPGHIRSSTWVVEQWVYFNECSLQVGYTIISVKKGHLNWATYLSFLILRTNSDKVEKFSGLYEPKSVPYTFQMHLLFPNVFIYLHIYVPKSANIESLELIAVWLANTHYTICAQAGEILIALLLLYLTVPTLWGMRHSVGTKCRWKIVLSGLPDIDSPWSFVFTWLKTQENAEQWNHFHCLSWY